MNGGKPMKRICSHGNHCIGCDWKDIPIAYNSALCLLRMLCNGGVCPETKSTRVHSCQKCYEGNVDDTFDAIDKYHEEKGKAFRRKLWNRQN